MERGLAVILVGAQGDANIGASARAMKNFGFTDLRLVGCTDHLTSPAYTWSAGAKDVLTEAKTYDSLDCALKDISFSVAFTRRIGKARKRFLTLPKAKPWLIERLNLGSMAFVFGREDCGLSDEEVASCDAIVSIPTSDISPSVNLAQSVLLACYEMFESQGDAVCDKRSVRCIDKERIDEVLCKWDMALRSLDYDDNAASPLRTKILDRLKKIFGRAGLTEQDAGMFDGLIDRIINSKATTDH